MPAPPAAGATEVRLRGARKPARTRAAARFGAWLSLVERLLWEQDVGGSNPLAPTNPAGPGSEGDGFDQMALARIYRPPRNAMQSGRAQTRKWVLEYEPATRREPDPLMGWTSVRDTLNEVRLRFDSREEAVAFAEKHGLDFTVIEPQDRIERPKSYADNFRWDRVRT